MTCITPCIEFIRHGLPEGGSRYRGNGIDDPLSETGWQQMWSAMGGDSNWDIVISSPMQRCQAFARAFADRQGLECIVEQDLEEVGFGDWEGRTKQQLKQENEAFFHAFYQDSAVNRPAGAESLEHFRERVITVFQQLCAQYIDQRVLVVSHAGVMRMVMMHTLNIPLSLMYRINIDYATRLRFQSGDHVRLMLD